ncbi:MAG TPA: surface lipoprotein assembly modifier [Paracoccaceae bacterium]|nr:surface lipoprotein assembly modifier [Paracoccaceae bacterium]HMO71785.1 surface lipoprotein assembly modifier [Paracoccaceae bacterium]
MYRNLIGLAGAALLALALSSSQATAQTGGVSAALARGDYAAARRLAEAEVSGRPDAALHLAHLEGLIALRAGEPAKAAEIFRAILSVAPGFEPSRVQLVVALDRLNRRAEARREAETLARTGRSPELRGAMAAPAPRGAVAPRTAPRPPVPAAEPGPAGSPRPAAEPPQATAPPAPVAARPAPAAEPRGGVVLRFAFLPSSNITGGTRAETVELGGLPFVLDPGSQEQGGVGLTFGATLWRSWDLGEHWRAMLSGSGDLRLYGNAPKPDEAELGLRLDLSRKFRQGGLSFGPRLGVVFKDGRIFRRQAGLGLAVEHLASQRLRFTASAEWQAQDHPDEPFRDGSLLSARLGLDWAASPRTVVSVELPFLREKTRAAHLAHTDTGLGIGLRHAFPAGLAIGAHVFAGSNRYDGVYPGFGVARRDRVQSLRLSISDSRFRILGQIPELSVTRRRQGSNIPLHDVTSTDVGLSFARRF